MSNATTVFSLENSFTVKGQLQGAYNHRFADYDRDGIADLLTWDNTRILVYSIVGDTQIANIPMDSPWNQSVVFADVNRDSIPDIVITFSKRTYLNNYLYIVRIYDGASQFWVAEEDTIPTSLDGYYGPGIQGVFTCFDLDGDGYGELILSVDSAAEHYYDPPGDLEWTEAGHTYCYNSFPNSLKWRSENYLRSISNISMGNNEYVPVGENYYYRKQQSAPGPGVDDNYFQSVLATMSADGFTSTLINQSSHGWCSVSELTNVDINQIRCFGNIDSSTQDVDILTEYIKELHGYPICGYYRDSLMLYRMISNGTVERVWAKDLGTYPKYSQYLFHPLLPGRLLALGGGRLFTFNGSTGEVSDSSVILPQGSLSWDRPNPDGIPRLIAVSGMTVSIYKLDFVTDINTTGGDPRLPSSFMLYPNYPNPFNPSTTIEFDLAKPTRATVRIYNTLGQQVRTLVDRPLGGGAHRVQWDGRDDKGNSMPTGVYLYRLIAGDFTQERKMVLVK